MQLISDIINELIDSSVSLESPFLKTKVMASKLKNTDLLNWVNDELNGYPDAEHLPNYRIHSASILCTYANGTRFTGIMQGQMRLPTAGYNDYWDNYFSTFPFAESISTLESFLKEKKSTELTIPLAIDICGILTNNMVKKGNPYFVVHSASKTIGMNAVVSVLSILRNKLLDLILKVDEEFGNVTDLSNLNDRANINRKINTIMQNTIITGDGNVINSGSQSNINVAISKGDFTALEKKLLENNVDSKDIEELRMVVCETPDNQKKEFGPGVKKWLSKMLSKSVDGTWKIGIAVASKLLEEALTSYYGFK